MRHRDKGEPIELRDTRARKRRGASSIEQKKWFWPVLTGGSFVVFSAGMFFLVSGLRFPTMYQDLGRVFMVRHILGSLVAGSLAALTCEAVRRQRQAEFGVMRARRRYERVEEELERFIVTLLRGLRLPLKEVQEGSRELAKEIREIREALSGLELPEEVRLMVGDAQDEGAIVEAARQVWLNSGKLDTLPRGLLKIGKLRKAEPQRAWVNVNSAIVEVVEGLQEEINATGASVGMKDLPACVADREMVKQLFHELIRNAIQYAAPTRKPEVRIWGWNKKGRSFYCVQDNGVGIPREDFEKIFEMFYSTQRSSAMSEGLGLAVVRRLLEQQGGRIWVKSEVGEGSTFSIFLPAK